MFVRHIEQRTSIQVSFAYISALFSHTISIHIHKRKIAFPLSFFQRTIGVCMRDSDISFLSAPVC